MILAMKVNLVIVLRLVYIACWLCNCFLWWGYHMHYYNHSNYRKLRKIGYVRIVCMGAILGVCNVRIAMNSEINNFVLLCRSVSRY